MLIGPLDQTAFGRAQAPPVIRRTLQPMSAIAPQAAHQFPDVTVVWPEALGHSPQVEDSQQFETAVIAARTGNRR